MIKNHYGLIVNSEEPITGVLQTNGPEWLFGDAIAKGIDLVWEEHLRECREEEHDRCNTDNVHLLIGFRQVSNGKYEPDPKAEYSAIVQEDYTQVVQSTWTSRAALCSPCFPGSADLGTPGEYLAFTIPPDLWGDFTNHLPIEKYEEQH